MLLNEIKDFSNYLYKTSNLVKLIDTEIYGLISDTIFKFKIVDLEISIINSEVKIFLKCVPLTHYLFKTYSDDYTFDYDKLNFEWFYTMEHARSYRKNRYAERQMRLF